MYSNSDKRLSRKIWSRINSTIHDKKESEGSAAESSHLEDFERISDINVC